MSQDERVLNAVTKVSPKFNPRIPLNKIVLARLGSLLDEGEEIVTVRFVRVAPATMDGGGLALISNRALLVVDAAPGQETRAYRVPAETIRHASAVRLKDGYKVAVLAEDLKTVEMLTSSSRVADDLVGFIDDLAPGSAHTNPRDLVENLVGRSNHRLAWLARQQMGVPWRLSCGTRELGSSHLATLAKRPLGRKVRWIRRHHAQNGSCMESRHESEGRGIAAGSGPYHVHTNACRRHLRFRMEEASALRLPRPRTR